MPGRSFHAEGPADGRRLPADETRTTREKQGDAQNKGETAMQKVRIGLIGLGFMGTTHFRIYKNLPDAEVVALADVDPLKRKGDVRSVSGNIGAGDNSVPLDLSGIRVYEDALEMICSGGLDMVDICVPTPFHKAYILAALSAGLHTFSEKPLCRNRGEMLEIADAVKKSGHFFNVGLCIRAWPEYRWTLERFRSGEFGKVLSAGLRRISPSVAGTSWNDWFMKEEMSGGALLDMHMHDTDAVRCFFGRPLAVTSFGARGLVSDSGIDRILTSYAFPDGSLITAEGNWGMARTVPFEMSFQMIFEKATVCFEGSGLKIYWNDGRTESSSPADPAFPTGWHCELAYFVECVKRGIRPDRYQNLQEILDSFCIVLAEEESVKTGKTVEVKYV